MSQQHLVGRARVIARIDLAPTHQPPATNRVVVATAASVVLSLLADALIVKIGTSLAPSIKGYGHFRFTDYGLLTTIGVIAAGMAWPIVTRITSSPRWLFIRLAVVVTLVLWLPDAWLFLKGEPGRAVLVLMVMHLVIALVTYNLLVHGAPVRPAAGAGDASAAGTDAATGSAPAAGAVTGLAVPDPAPPAPPAAAGTETDPPVSAARPDTGGPAPDTGGPAPAAGAVPADAPDAVPADAPGAQATAAALPRRLWIGMAVATGLEFLVGIAGLVVVPLGRPNGWLPAQGEALYVVHAVVGAALAVGGLLILIRTARAERLPRVGAVMGATGLGLGVVGGVLASYHAARFGGLTFMLVGAIVAGLGYLIPVIS